MYPADSTWNRAHSINEAFVRSPLPFLICSLAASAQTISTLAGNPDPFVVLGPPGQFIESTLGRITTDSVGNVYIAVTVANQIVNIDPVFITVVAGTGTPGFSGDAGPATGAQLSLPTDIAFDTAGNLYVPDFENHRVLRYNSPFTTDTIASTRVIGNAS